jgi:alanyl-tRNA synthetase
VLTYAKEENAMKKLSGQQIRNEFKQFFAEREHMVFPSASLVPHDDPTLLWINAGMAPLKVYFDGREIPEKPRIVSSQKCIRTDDIENVGHTARHQTMFEMLGNFSFGDYFKQEAITWAWDFLTKVLELDPLLLSVTVHHEDEEAFQIWNEQIGLPKERIVPGDEDNFWEIGEGPCGPCSEIFYDRGEQFGCGSPDCKPGCDCDRFLEIWNLVFTQYNKTADGSYLPLPKKNIDTGMGLERITSVLQEVPNNFETDLFRPIIQEIGRISGASYGIDESQDVHFKIIADHVRTVAFTIGDGALPGNEGRNYIIRRLLRRAVRSGRKLGVEKAFLHQLIPVVAGIMGDDYPEIREKMAFIQRVVHTEEERFLETLAEGESLLQSTLQQLANEGESVLSGEDAFRLYDTFGFPIDLTEEMAMEQGVSVDREGFLSHLEAQRHRARSARHTAEGMNADRGDLETLTTPSQFVGYSQLSSQSQVVAILVNNHITDTLSVGEEGDVLLAETPFYAESGGQVADTGILSGDALEAEVVDVRKAPHGQHIQRVKVVSGLLRTGQVIDALVSASDRRDTVKNHTATHLLHKALREVLGEHVAQAGSLVEPSRLRFDFSHFGGLSQDELEDVEQRVNDAIWRDETVEIAEMDIEDAKHIGAMALFGEKYGKRVRVVKAGDYSIELCGGCHVDRTGMIGMFRVISEAGIGAGVRRIEAVTGRHAYTYAKGEKARLEQVANLLKVTVPEVLPRLERVLDDIKGTERELESVKAKLNRGVAQELLESVTDVEGVPVLAAVVSEASMDGLRQTVDELRGKLDSYVIVLGNHTEGKVQFVAAVSKDLFARKLHAGQIVKEVAEFTGGGGGGRPDLAQAGGRDVSKLAGAIEKVVEIVSSYAGKSL